MACGFLCCQRSTEVASLKTTKPNDLDAKKACHVHKDVWQQTDAPKFWIEIKGRDSMSATTIIPIMRLT